MNLVKSISLLALTFLFLNVNAQEKGYYRYPTLYKNFVVFTAEGDLWKFNQETGLTLRLTTHHGMESNAAISGDGKWIAFNAQYDGPTEVYVMPLEGGIPKRITYEGFSGRTAPELYGWTSDGKLIVSTSYYSTLPARQLVLIDPENLGYDRIPLAQADEGVYDEAGNLYFTRLQHQSSFTRRYKGGTAQNLWKFDGSSEAVPLTADYSGTSKNPMFYNGKIYFLSDRDGTMNLWSMLPDGSNLEQLTNSVAWDLKDAKLQDGKVIYQKQADIFVYDLESGKEKLQDIYLISDFDQKRPYWVEEPDKRIQALDISENGDKVVITSRGRIFTTPVEGGRWIEITRKSGIRYKQAKFGGEDDVVFFLSDESGEMELWKTANDGFSKPEQLTFGSEVLIMNFLPSPNAKYVVYTEKDYALKLCDVEKKTTKQIDLDNVGGFGYLSWSPDSKWLTYVDPADNQADQIKVLNVETGKAYHLTTDRFESYNPVFSTDGNWLYFISDRTFNTSVGSPWGPRQPEPFYNKTSKIYMLALNDTIRSPYLADNELYTTGDNKKDKKDSGTKMPDTDMENAITRLYEVPVPAENIAGLEISDKYLYWVQSDVNDRRNRKLFSFEISNKKDNKPVEVADKVNGFILSGDGTKLLIRKADGVYVTDANGKKAELKDAKVSLKDWTFKIDPVEDWKQLMLDAWRLERDYFYDKNMHGVDWDAVLERHLPLVDRLTDRYELDDVLIDMVSELSALHTFVRGGDKRTADEDIKPASLGARLEKSTADGGYKIDHIFNGEPDLPEERSPLSQPHLKIKVGDVITKVNGVDVLEVEHITQLLSEKAGQEVRLSLKRTSGETFDEIVKPISMNADANLRYCEWEYTRRLEVEDQSDSRVGYFHMRAMGGGNFQEFVKGYYPVYNREGLIIDVRNNRGGNIDSWVLSRLLRKAWFYWQTRAGSPYWNMQYAFRGHIVVLCNEFTASDGEAFSEGIKRLDLGTVIGTRTWGGEIWLSSSNVLVDNGIATASEMGVYSEEGEWLIEGHGVEPDIVVDNLPYETFKGKDAQLEAAIKFLQKKMEEEPITIPQFPPLPDKSVDYNR
ncbi:S41 family peptidase [Draconibacterium sp. IB214405]|uniref:S41 family peptidase n=1 Tax=Draconibacterium sp. IB214405 TaxID=3097352 RepID=UPI002A133034|nr:S41 family peptidase [Draconibacterium sp. IB214405]MDX8338809.1 S41 family peptidase [Draconibacterium sp. IB214405]